MKRERKVPTLRMRPPPHSLGTMTPDLRGDAPFRTDGLPRSCLVACRYRGYLRFGWYAQSEKEITWVYAEELRTVGVPDRLVAWIAPIRDRVYPGMYPVPEEERSEILIVFIGAGAPDITFWEGE